MYSYRHFILASTAHPQQFHRFLDHLATFMTQAMIKLSNNRRDLVQQDFRGALIQQLEAKWLGHLSAARIHNAGVDNLVRNLEHTDRFNEHSEASLSKELQGLNRLKSDLKITRRGNLILPEKAIVSMLNGQGNMSILRGHYGIREDLDFRIPPDLGIDEEAKYRAEINSFKGFLATTHQESSKVDISPFADSEITAKRIYGQPPQQVSGIYVFGSGDINVPSSSFTTGHFKNTYG